MTKILVLEDDFYSAGELIRLIKKETIPVPVITLVNSIGVAEFLLKEQVYELVIFNLELPGAFPFLQFVQQTGTLPVITINDTPENRAAVQLVEAGFLGKPFTPDAVNELLSRYGNDH